MALTADAKITRFGVPDIHEPINKGILHGITIYRGGFALTRSGYLVNPDSGVQSTDLVWGVVERSGPGTADTGPGIAGDAATDGAVTAEVSTGKFFFGAGTGADTPTVANLGQQMYVIDSITVGKTNGSGTRPTAGTLVQIDTTMPGGYAVDVGSGPPGTGL
jgi:hypothetical protein